MTAAAGVGLDAWPARRLGATAVARLPIYGGSMPHQALTERAHSSHAKAPCGAPFPEAGDLPPHLARALARLHAELVLTGVSRLKPRAYLADEWFAPEGLAAIAVPFWLADPRLTALERAARGEAEGETPDWCAALLRHEAGHCFDHAYGVAQRGDFQRVFGARGAYRPDAYAFDPASRDYVRHLPGGYAQAHPDEDFAETFAVVVTPGRAWRDEYASWPAALRKLEYVSGLVTALGARPVPTAARATDDLCAARRIRRTVAAFFADRARSAPKHPTAAPAVLAGRPASDRAGLAR